MDTTPRTRTEKAIIQMCQRSGGNCVCDHQNLVICNKGIETMQCVAFELGISEDDLNAIDEGALIHLEPRPDTPPE